MISPLKKTILETLAEIYDLAGDIRFGQLMANLSYIGECETDISIWDIEDDQMLDVLLKHLSDLRSARSASDARQEQVTEKSA